MSRSALFPSFLERFLDRSRDPAGGAVAGRTSAQMEREFFESLKRDLERLLNTRRPCTSTSAVLHGSLLERSILAWGIPDPAGFNFCSRVRREDFLRAIGSAIEYFEPRLVVLDVDFRDPEHPPAERTLDVRVLAALRSDPRVRMRYDSFMSPGSTRIHVEEGAA